MKNSCLSALVALLFLFPTVASAELPLIDRSAPETETALFALG